MNKYYIKEKNEESGPYDLDELKALKIKRGTLVRPEGSEDWKKASLYYELQRITNRGMGAGTAFLIVMIFIFAGYYIYREKYFPNSKDDGIVSSQQVEEDVQEAEAVEETPIAPDIEYKLSKHEKKLFREMFKDCNKTKRQLIKACNYTNSEVRNYAVSIAGHSPGNFNLAQICDVFDHCYKNWKYVNDPRTTEYVSKASETIKNNLNGDCDDFAVLMCSLIMSVGGEARINYAWGSDGGHAFTEVNLGKTNQDEVLNYITKRYYTLSVFGANLNGKLDKQRNLWLNLDWFAENPGGEYFKYMIGQTYYIHQKFCEDIDASNAEE